MLIFFSRLINMYNIFVNNESALIWMKGLLKIKITIETKQFS